MLGGRSWYETMNGVVKKLFDNLAEPIQKEVEQACKKWGFDFYAGMGEWWIKYGGKYVTQKYQKSEGGYLIYMGDARFIFDLVEPELSETLEYQVDGQSLGSLLADVNVETDDHEWVILKVEAAFESNKGNPQILTNGSEVDLYDTDFSYYGWIPKQIAEAVKAFYDEDDEDGDDGAQLICSLPDFTKEDIYNKPGLT